MKAGWTAEKRKAQSDRNSGKNNPFYGKKHSAETCRKISEANTGRITPDEVRHKISEANKGKQKPGGFGAKISAVSKNRKHAAVAKTIISIKAKKRSECPSYREKISMAQKNRKRGQCPHCLKEMDICNLKRYHLDKCKMNLQSSTVQSPLP